MGQNLQNVDSKTARPGGDTLDRTAADRSRLGRVLLIHQKLDFQWQNEDSEQNEHDPMNKLTMPSMRDTFPDSREVKEEIIAAEGDGTEKAMTMRSLKPGSKFKRNEKLKGGTMTKWAAHIKEKGAIVNIDLR